MKRTSIGLALTLLASAAAQATSTTFTVTNATGSAVGTITSNQASLTNLGPGNATLTGTFTISTPSLTPDSTGNLTEKFTLTFSGGTMLGTLKIPATVLAGGTQSATGSATIDSGTGAYSGYTGSFPTVSGSGSFVLSTLAVTLSFHGDGTINTSGSTGGGTNTPTPTITAVLDAGSYTANIAEGSIFVVQGSNLSASGYTQMSFPLPTTSGGVKITFTPAAGGSGTDVYLVYLYNQNGTNQLAALLPSSVAAGNYNVTVTNNGAVSAAFAATVVQRKLTLITQDSSGSGIAVVQNYVSISELDVNRFTTGSVNGVPISPAKPGQVLIAWGTGMGPVSGGDNTASPGYDFSKNGVNVQVIVGGMNIAPQYAGRAPGLAGTDQINFQLPSNVPTGCTVSFQISVNGNLSNPSFIAIAPDANSSACVLPGFTTTQLQNFDNGGTYTVGSFDITQFAENVSGVGAFKADAISGGFTRFTGFQLSGAAQYYSLLTTGGCRVLTTTTTSNSSQTSTGIVPTAGNVTLLDAGTITLTGPTASGLSNVPLKETLNAYYLSIAEEGLSLPGLTNLGSIVAGTYNLNGAGGKDVGPFNASLTLGSPLTVTGGLPTAVNRSAGLTLNWTGGNTSDIVELIGGSISTTISGTTTTSTISEFFCTTTAGQGGITVSPSVLSQVPAVSSTSLTSGNYGFLELASFVNPGTSSNGNFTAPLTAGGNIDFGLFTALIGSFAQATYQ